MWILRAWHTNHGRQAHRREYSNTSKTTDKTKMAGRVDADGVAIRDSSATQEKTNTAPITVDPEKRRAEKTRQEFLYALVKRHTPPLLVIRETKGVTPSKITK